jgi:hypothetical protein
VVASFFLGLPPMGLAAHSHTMKPLLPKLRSQWLTLVFLGACIALLVTILVERKASAQQQSSLTGFTIGEIRFDESMGEKKPTPTLPSAWRFIGVSNGEKENSNNLWFQDKDGSIYLVEGFTTATQFIIRENIQKLNASH